MNKIISALNVMIENPEKIQDIEKDDFGELYFFLYLGKQVWSVYHNRDDEETIISYFPGMESTKSLISAVGVESIPFSTREYKTTEARETFSELHRLVRNKYYNIDDVLNEILGETG